MCVGPLSYERLDIAENECDVLLRTANESQAKPQELVMTAASPGIIALTLKNNHYPSYEDYVFALAYEMRQEYELIVSKGLYFSWIALTWPWNGTCPTRTSHWTCFRTWSAYTSGPSTTPSRTYRESRCGCTSVGGTPKDRTTTMFPWKTSCLCYTKPELGRW